MSTTEWRAKDRRACETPVPLPFSAYQRAVKQKRRVRRAEGEEQSEGARPEGAQAGSKARRDLRQQAYEARVSGRNMLCVFL